MINTIYLDHEFNFLLLENTQEENSESITKFYLNIETDATTGQRLEISVAGGAVVTENIASDTVVNFELSPEYWADDNATEITPKNDDITGATITINFPKTFTTSAALNYVSDTEFDIQAQNEAFAESGSSGIGSGGSGGAAIDFVETIRNIGFRLLDEPSNVNAFYDEAAEEVQIKWTDPADIATNEPTPATWAGTVVVRKEGSAPRHRWDGTEIEDSTTRDEYSATALIDNTIDTQKSYYYGIFPYDTKGDYRFTKVVAIFSQPIPAPEIVNLVVNGTAITVNYSVADRYTYDYITLVYKKNSAPADKTDGTAVSLSASDNSITISGFDINATYYFKIFAQVTGASEELESNTESAATSPESYRCLQSINVDGNIMQLLQIDDFSVIPNTLKTATSFSRETLYPYTLTQASYVTTEGTDFYYQYAGTTGADKVVVGESNYIELDCPAGLFSYAGYNDFNGLRVYDKIAQNNALVMGFSASEIGNNIRSHYIGVVLEDTYNRGYLLIEDWTDLNIPGVTNGYRIFIFGGVVNGVDYIYETFKNR